MLEVGATTWFLPERGVQGLRWASRAGVRSVHFDQNDLRDGVAQYAETASALGVALSGFAIVALEDVGLGNSSHAREVIDQAVGFARDLGVPLVYLPAFGNAGVSSQADRNRFADLVSFAIDKVGDSARIAIEAPLGADGLLALFDAVADPRLQMILDTQNPILWGEDVVAIVEMFAAKVVAVHVKDGADRAGDRPIGQGRAPIRETFDALVRHCVTAPILLENDYRMSKGPAAIAADTSAVRSLWALAVARST